MSKIGYAAGTVEAGGEWLTVLGSAHGNHLYPDRTSAEIRGIELRKTFHDPKRIVVRRVREVWHPGVTVTQTAYRIVADPLAEQRATMHATLSAEAPL